MAARWQGVRNGETTKRLGVSHPMAYVFDYNAFKELCDINLETFVAPEDEIDEIEPVEEETKEVEEDKELPF